MLTVMLVAVDIIQIQASVLIVVLMLRSQSVTPARAGIITYLAATAAWSGLAIHWQLTSFANPPGNRAWMLVVVAVLISGVRVAARGLEEPRWRPSRKYLVGLMIHPLAMFVIAAVPAWHGFVVTVDSAGHASYEAGYWIHAAVSYVLLFTAGVRFVRARSGIRALVDRSAVVTLLPWTLPFFATVISVIHERASGPEFTPVAFILTTLLIGRAMLYDGLAEIVPIARVHVFESFADAIFVVDSTWCLVDANARALRLLGEDREASEVAGTRLDVLSPEVSHMCLFNGEHDIEVAGNKLVMGVRRSPLKDVKGRTVGALIHVRDITVDVLQRRELVRVRDALADEAMINEALRAELAEQVVRDAGTGLHNRRFVFEALPAMAATCEREESPLSVVMLDVDRFKSVNDTYGHTVGDRVLQEIAVALDEAADGAVVARFGGEEFLVLLPGIATGEAVARAEALRAACASVEVPIRDGTVRVTVSAGVATGMPGLIDVAALIDHADGALYDAKDSGRNRVCAARVVLA